MNTSIVKLFSAVGITSALLTLSAAGQTIVDDQFRDGSKNRTASLAEPLDAQWFTIGSGTAATIQTDTTTGPDQGSADNALELTVGGQGFRGLIGIMPSSFTLGIAGSSITLAFDLRYTSSPANSASGLRFGLYNSNGTAIVADQDTVNSQNDIGYNARISTGGQAAEVTLGRETGGNGFPTSGTDVTLISGTGTGVSSVAGFTSYYRLELGLTRNALGGIDLVVRQGVNTQTLTQIYSGTDASALTYTFDEIAIFNGSPTQTFRVDNVTVTGVVPEPSVTLLALLGASILAFRRCGRRLI